MKLIDPNASIPIVQVSVLRSQDATELLRMGKNVLRMVIGQSLTNGMQVVHSLRYVTRTSRSSAPVRLVSTM